MISKKSKYKSKRNKSKSKIRGALHCGGKSAASGRDDASVICEKHRNYELRG
jgi:hypothetical protein